MGGGGAVVSAPLPAFGRAPPLPRGRATAAGGEGVGESVKTTVKMMR